VKTPKPEISIGLQLTPWLEELVSVDKFWSIENDIIP
jgi:hypothetical protein